MAVSLPKLRGAFALAFLFDGQDNLLIGARQGAPLAVGYGQGDNAGTMYLGSDALALAPFTDTLTYLEEGDWVVLTHDKAVFFDAGHLPVERKRLKTMASAFLVDKGNHRHFMAKEIHEQPEVVARTLAHYLDMSAGRVALPFALPVDPAATRQAHHHRLRHRLHGRADLEILVREVRAAAGLDRGRLGVPLRRGADGERAASASSCRNRARPPTRWPRCAIARRRGKSCCRSSTSPPRPWRARAMSSPRRKAGPEIGVASTKAFTCQLAVLACLAPWRSAGRAACSPRPTSARLVGELIAVPGLMAEAMKREPDHRAPRPASSPACATCSTSAAALRIRWRWKAR